MERELWPPLYHLLRAGAKDFRQEYAQYQPWVLVAVRLGASCTTGPSPGPASRATGAPPRSSPTGPPHPPL